MTVKEFAKKYGVSERRVQILIKQGRISAVLVYGHRFEIPDDAKFPRDERQTTRTRRCYGTLRRYPLDE